MLHLERQKKTASDETVSPCPEPKRPVNVTHRSSDNGTLEVTWELTGPANRSQCLLLPNDTADSPQMTNGTTDTCRWSDVPPFIQFHQVDITLFTEYINVTRNKTSTENLSHLYVPGKETVCAQSICVYVLWLLFLGCFSGRCCFFIPGECIVFTRKGSTVRR